MLKTISILTAALATSTPALAETFVHNGTTYVYAIQQRGNVKTIKGQDATMRRPFTLHVRNGWVEGVVDGNPVSFSTRDVVRLKTQSISTEVAAR
jgi:hypothetical protein